MNEQPAQESRSRGVLATLLTLLLVVAAVGSAYWLGMGGVRPWEEPSAGGDGSRQWASPSTGQDEATREQAESGGTDAEGLQAAEKGRIGRPALVYFHSDFCRVCKEIAPDVERLSQTFADTVSLVRMNIDHDDSRSAVRRYGVAATPTFVLLDAHGEQLEYFRGWPGEERLSRELDAAVH